MRRLVVVLAATALAGTLVASWGAAASAREAGPNATRAAEQRRAKLPPLPANIRQRKRWNIAVKCDTPPFGYIGARSQNAGFDVEIARWFARFAFGKPNRVNLSCVTTPAREPALTTDRADLVIATFAYNTDRETRIDFSRAYYGATGRLLVRNNGPLQSLRDMAGKTVATTSGSVYERWVRNCYRDTRTIVTDSFTNALLAFRDGRADALMFDDTIVLGIAVTDPTLKLTNDLFLSQPYGIGIKQGNVALKRWVDAALAVMKQRDLFMPILRNTVPPRQVQPFSRNILRPRQNLQYNQGDITTVCS
jgi:polar amino acid transport system substrate-binding protein